MALPLPKVIADVGPGGPLVTSMGGINSLANDNILRQMNQIKKTYLPSTLQSEAASKLAYANLMGPQFLAKLLGNDAVIANMGDEAARAALEKSVTAGMGSGKGLNAINQMPASQQVNTGVFSGIGQPSTNSFSGYLTNAFKNLVGQAPKAVQQQGGGNALANSVPQPMPQSDEPQVGDAVYGDQGQGPTPYQASDQGISANNPEVWDALNAWKKSPKGRIESAKKGDNYLPDEQKLLNWYHNQQAQERGMQSPVQQPMVQQPTYAENTGRYKGIIKEGEKLGEKRAEAIDDLDQQYQQAVQSEVPLKHMNEIVSNPVFQKLRQLPIFQKIQLDAKSKIGTPEEQKLIGDFQTTALKAVAETVMGFKGRILDKEIGLANDMKINANDTIGVMLGKLPSIETFQEMTKQRSRIASKLIADQHISRGDALEKADKMVDGAAIRKKVELELNPITDADIDLTAKETGMTRAQVIQRLKSEGRYNG